jgi:2-oxo-4-hydroxy-4-carboxy-5-ureidoimidazoline decarboxylase
MTRVKASSGSTEVAALDLAGLNKAKPLAAQGALLPCCASQRWAEEVIKARPYAMLEALVATSDAALKSLAWDDILEALAAHPRIGAAATGDERESTWSRQEQAGAADVDELERRRMHNANLAYEQRFGFGFLICATGRSAVQLRSALEARMRNDPATEREVVRSELTAIVRLRLAKAFA